MDIDSFSPSLLTFGRRSRAVTPNDSTDLPGGPAKSIIVTSAGDVKFLPLDNPDNEPVTLSGRSVGDTIPFIVRRVFSTGTTATVRTIED